MNRDTHLHLRSSTFLLFLVIVLILSLSGAAPAMAQQGESAEEPSDPQVSLDDLLEKDEFVLTGEGYSYDSGDRRDPFKSLLIAREVRCCEGHGRRVSPDFSLKRSI